MPLNTFGVVSAVTPSVIETYFSHFLNRAPLRQKPTAHISYHEGLRLIRQFLEYSSKHTVEDLQAFTAQWVPAPTWVRIQDVDISARYLEQSARLIQEQLGPAGIDLVGGKSWWQWRRPDAPCKAEWVEMKKDYNERKRSGEKCERAMLYVHGGAYYFGSVDEHRYQMQRHARKLKARVFAPRYRLAPQFPFPCGLQDCIAAYLQLLEDFEPTQILFAGDSAGAGMVLSMLVTLRDQGLSLPAGTILLSPWVDLTHSFPSVAGDGAGDYIPAHGFHHKPSMVWPPPNTDELRDLAATPIKRKKSKDDLSSMSHPDQNRKVPHADQDLSLYVNGERVTIKDQIQMYTPNHMLAHPLVSPVQQASLGGLPPMLIQVGGSELLRDEQIYIAHKAADPMAYPPSEHALNEYGGRRDDIGRYPPTSVQLQVWDDLCHVPQTLSFTRPAKYMYRAVAQFGAWALANAQHKPIMVTQDDQLSIISSGPGDNDPNASTTNLSKTSSRNPDQADPKIRPLTAKGQGSDGSVGKAGDPLPQFIDHMVRQRVDRHGVTYPLAHQSEIPCLHLNPESIGAIKSGPVGKWLLHKRATDTKFSSEKKKVQKKRLKEMQAGYAQVGPDEHPPPTALAGRRTADMPPEKRLKKSWGLAMWAGWGSSHDENQINREENMERDPSVRPGSRQPNAVGTAYTAETAGFKPFHSTGEDIGKKRETSSSSIFSDRSKQGERSISPFVATPEEARPERTVLGGSGLRPPSDSLSRTISRTSSRYSATYSQQDYDLTASTAPPAPASRGPERARPDSEALTVVPRVQSPSTERVLSPTNEVSSEGRASVEPPETPQESAGNHSADGPVAYPFKIRNPIPGYTSSVASSTHGDSNEGQTSSTLFPSAGARTTAARPISSINAFSDKEIVMAGPELELASDSSNNPSNPGTPTDGRNMPFRMRNLPSDPRLGQTARLDTNMLTTVPTNASQASSIPTSPAASYRGKAPDYQHRNPAFDPRTMAAQVFGGSSQPSAQHYPDQMRAPPPPKPVGFAYNPRDLRNAMLNRAAAENAVLSGSRGSSPAPASPAPSHYVSHPFGNPVELPAAAVPHSHSHENVGRDSTNSRTSDNSKLTTATNTFTDFKLPDPAPVELSGETMPSSRRPLSPQQTTSSPSFHRPDLAVRENITMPVVETPRNSHPPPPPPPKDDPAPAVRSPPRKQSSDVAGKGIASAAPPVIGDIPGLQDENNGSKGLDFGLDAVAKGQDEEKPPAWL
ncbi:hypothetical protein Q7P37_004825 [Cladosporium fusiforme]